jgi:hypothetical protein
MGIKRTVVDIFGTFQGDYYSLSSIAREGDDASVRWYFYASKQAKDAGATPLNDCYVTWKGDSPFTAEALAEKTDVEIAHEASISRHFIGGEWVD